MYAMEVIAGVLLTDTASDIDAELEELRFNVSEGLNCSDR